MNCALRLKDTCGHVVGRVLQFTDTVIAPAVQRVVRVEWQPLASPGSAAANDERMAATTPTARNVSAVRVLLLLWLLGASAGVTAFTAPAVGDFGYDIYDIVVNQILNGPIGFIGGVALIVFGATKIMTNWMLTILCIIAGTILIRAADLVVTLGAMI